MTASLVVFSTPAVRADAPTRYADVVFSDVTTTKDIVYGQARNSRGQDQDLLFRLIIEPAGDPELFRPVFLYAPGGGFYQVDNCPTSYLNDLARRGWVVLCMEYRSRPDIPHAPASALPPHTTTTVDAAYDAQLDMQAAIRWIRRHAVTWRLDAGRIAVGGHSAGAIMSQSAAFNSEEPPTSDNPEFPHVVTAAISHSGGWAVGLQGTIEPGSAPVAYFNAVDDPQVPFPTAVLPCAATTAVANICEFTPYAGGGHGFQGAEIGRDFAYRQVVGAPRTPTILTLDPPGPLRPTQPLVVRATLTSAGAPLVGRRVVFTLGSQQVEATTGPAGVAEATIIPVAPPADAVTATFSGEQTRAATLVAPGAGYAGSNATYRWRS